MANELQGFDIGFFTASADLSAKQYYFVKLSSETKVTVCSAVTDKPIGVLQNKPASGEQALGSETTVHVCGQAIGAGASGTLQTAFINVTNGRGA